MKKAIFIALQFVFLQVSQAQPVNYLKQCWENQVNALNGQFLNFYFQENCYELYHSAEPWQKLFQSIKGEVWTSHDAFMMKDTMYGKYYSKMLYNNKYLLMMDFGSDKLGEVSQETYAAQPIEVLGYSPALLIQYFYEQHPDPCTESDDQYTVYLLRLNNKVVRLFISNATGLLDQVVILKDHELYGDVYDTIKYGNYTTSGAVHYPSMVYRVKMNGKVKDTIIISEAKVMNKVTPVLVAPGGYTMTDAKEKEPEIEVKSYSDHIHWSSLFSW